MPTTHTEIDANASFWNKQAESYSRQALDNPEAFERKIDHTKTLMSPDDTVLGIGCGTGSLLLRLTDHASKLHGLDISAEMIRIAEEKREAASADNLSFHVGAFDENQQRFDPASLDGVLAFSILHLVDDKEAALSQIFNLLKPGGYFVTSTACLSESWIPFKPVLTIMKWIGKAPPKVGVFSKAELHQAFADAGFTGLITPDVGASAMFDFAIARKPA